MFFPDLALSAPILKALAEEGYSTPTPIQERSIPHILKGKDLLGIAQTGTGKTASFALPIIELLFSHHSRHSDDRRNPGSIGSFASSGGLKQSQKRPIRALILTPTRELALQIDESLARYGRYTDLRRRVIFGGVGQGQQVDALSKGIDILIATPGRLLDLMSQGFIDLSEIEFFVLDEADRMLDMGFIHDVRKILTKLPSNRQSLFFSATMPPAITELSHKILTDPVRVEVTPPSRTADKIDQSVYFVGKHDKKSLLKDLLRDTSIERVLVFTRTKHGADKVVKDLNLARIPAKAIHGNKSQNNRQAALKGFKNKEIRVLVATDIAARGIDIDELTHVINFELPNIAESYVHRIGRTGRAGASGIAIAFCDAEEREYLRDIEKLIGGMKIRVIDDHAYPLIGEKAEKSTGQRQKTKAGSGTNKSFSAGKKGKETPEAPPLKIKFEHRKGQREKGIEVKHKSEKYIQSEKTAFTKAPGSSYPKVSYSESKKPFSRENDRKKYEENGYPKSEKSSFGNSEKKWGEKKPFLKKEGPWDKKPWSEKSPTEKPQKDGGKKWGEKSLGNPRRPSPTTPATPRRGETVSWGRVTKRSQRSWSKSKERSALEKGGDATRPQKKYTEEKGGKPKSD